MTLEGRRRTFVAGPFGRRPGHGRVLRVRRCLLLTASFAAFAPAVALTQTTGPVREAPAPPSDGRVWLGLDGTPLPFRSDDEVEDFLRTAQVVSRTRVPQGITRPDALVLERDGVRARAILREVEEEKRRTRVGDRYYVRFRDSHAHECAAYILARRLGLDSVPPTVPRRVDARPGSVQMWVEGARSLTEDFQPANPMAWVRQLWDQDLFDNIILNVDRNATNILIGPGEKLWSIDHTRAFQPQAVLLSPETLQRINRTFWDRLRALGDEELKDLVREHLDVEQLQTLVARRSLLVEHVERLVEEHGEAAVFY